MIGTEEHSSLAGEPLLTRLAYLDHPHSASANFNGALVASLFHKLNGKTTGVEDKA